MRKLPFSDHLEKSVAQVLYNKGIKFVYESEDKDQRLDFYLPDADVYIEIKQYHSERISNQLSTQDNVIVLQGKKAVSLFEEMLQGKDLRHESYEIAKLLAEDEFLTYEEAESYTKTKEK